MGAEPPVPAAPYDRRRRAAGIGGKFPAVGYGKRKGDSIPFVFQYDDGPFYNTSKWDAAAQAWTMTMESAGKDGKRQLFAVDTLRRK